MRKSIIHRAAGSAVVSVRVVTADGRGRSTRDTAESGFAAELRDAGFDDVTEVGHGGFGVVYRCAQPSLDRTVAVKVLTSDLDPDNVERFVREQRAMGKLSDHPHIVTIHEVGTTATGRPFIVMPYYAKDSLEALIRRHGPLDSNEAVSMGVKLAGALQAAHSGGVVHRDVKPGNILLSDYGEPQLTDFGIARIAGGFQTTTGVITGSPAYTAPEVLEGATPTPQSDVYSLGATLFCAMTGHAAFERRSGEKVVAQFLRITSQPMPDLRNEGCPPMWRPRSNTPWPVMPPTVPPPRRRSASGFAPFSAATVFSSTRWHIVSSRALSSAARRQCRQPVVRTRRRHPPRPPRRRSTVLSSR